jgi:cellobiose phosphorylase
MYRVALEWSLGFRVQGANLVMDPCIPRHWPGFEIAYRYRSTRYEINVENPAGVCRGVVAIRLDDAMLPEGKNFLVPLVDDGATHRVKVVLG